MQSNTYRVVERGSRVSSCWKAPQPPSVVRLLNHQSRRRIACRTSPLAAENPRGSGNTSASGPPRSEAAKAKADSTTRSRATDGTDPARSSSASSKSLKNGFSLPGLPDPSTIHPIALITIGRLVSAAVLCGLASLLAGWLDVDLNAQFAWKDGAPLLLGAAAAVPVILVTAALLLPPVDPGFDSENLLEVVEIVEDKADVMSALELYCPSTEEPQARLPQPPVTPEAVKQALWFFQMQYIQPWLPPMQWSDVAANHASVYLAVYWQELLIRGVAGSLLVGWYTGLLAGATDAYNPIYWAKVFDLLTPDTARWMAAVSFFVAQLGPDISSAPSSARLTRFTLNHLGRVSVPPGMAEEEREEVLLPTAEERLVYGAEMLYAGVLTAACNIAWAASGSLWGPFVTRVVIDGVGTAIQNVRCCQLYEQPVWEDVRRLKQAKEDEEEEEEDEDEEEERGK